MTYNAKEQTATQTDNSQPTNLTWTRAFMGRGQFEQVQETSNANPPTTHSYTFSLLA